MISPTVGRIVWYYVAPDHPPLAAIVVHVLDDRQVNLTVFGRDGGTHGRRHVPLLQDDDPAPTGEHAAWMPYQMGQAARAEAAEAKLVRP